MDQHEVANITHALHTFKIAKLKVSRLGLPEVDKLLVKAEALLVTRAEHLKKALWEGKHHEPGRGENQSKGGPR